MVGRIFFDEANVTTTPAYGVVNLLAGVRRARWAVHLYARNATGTRYVTMIAPGFYRVPGLPRRFGVSISTGDRP